MKSAPEIVPDNVVHLCLIIFALFALSADNFGLHLAREATALWITNQSHRNWYGWCTHGPQSGFQCLCCLHFLPNWLPQSGKLLTFCSFLPKAAERAVRLKRLSITQFVSMIACQLRFKPNPIGQNGSKSESPASAT